MKNIIAIVLACIMTVAVLAACGETCAYCGESATQEFEGVQLCDKCAGIK